MPKEKVKKCYSKRTEKDFNCFRAIFLFIVTKIIYNIRFKLVYRLEVHGKENIPKGNDYIVAGNHLSTLDPVLIASVMPRPVAYMAKKELFEIPVLRLMLDWLGAFAVNRDKLEISTIKTVYSIKKTKWVLGLFPQGTREKPGVIHNISKGFVGLAKKTQCNILPVGIMGTHEVKRWPFSGKIIVNIGEFIPYSLDSEEIIQKWAQSIENLTGFSYVPEG